MGRKWRQPLSVEGAYFCVVSLTAFKVYIIWHLCCLEFIDCSWLSVFFFVLINLAEAVISFAIWYRLGETAGIGLAGEWF
jgi:hypothetical protein